MADILSKKEIDALLNAIDEELDSDIELEEKSFSYHKQISLYDFRRPALVSKEQLILFSKIHDSFNLIFQKELSSFLKTPVELQLHCVDQMTYGEFLMSLPSPANFNTFQLKPLNGLCVFETNPSITFPMIDLILGGQGEPFEDYRPFTETEFTLLENLNRITMKSLHEAFSKYAMTYPIIEEKSSFPCSLNVVPQNEIIISVVIEIIFKNVSGMLNFCYPVSTMNPFFEYVSKIHNTTINIDDLKDKLTTNIDVLIYQYKDKLQNIKTLKVNDFIPFSDGMNTILSNPIRTLQCEQIESKTKKQIKILGDKR